MNSQKTADNLIQMNITKRIIDIKFIHLNKFKNKKNE